jgi:hypothetical protein
MVAKPAAPFRSANAGEFSPDADGRVDIKQYYSAGKAFKNTEPVPQSGFRQMGGTWRMGFWRKPLAARTITAPSTLAGPHTGTQTVWTGTVAGTVAAVLATSFAISAGTATFELQAEIAGVWTKIAGPFAVATGTPVTRLAAFAPGDQRTATGLRIRATFSTSATVTIGSVSAFHESGTALAPRYCDLTTDDGDTLICAISAGIADFFTEAGFVGSARLSAVTSAMLPDLDFYAEASTIGVFHGELQTGRLFMMTPGQLHDWRADLWPYDPVPKADLGGSYPQTNDVWNLTIRWAENRLIYVSLTVDGESAPAVPLTDAGGTPVVAGSGDWNKLALDIAAAINALPSIPGGVTATADLLDPGPASGSADIEVTFGGASSGSEYQLSALITNTADASVLPYHTQIGKTEFEALFSTLRGWPGSADLVQDRMGYVRIPAVTGAMALSRIAEYFDLNSDATTDQAARLDKIRSQTNETILAIKESNFVLVFTDRGVYFINNRTIERNTPLNFVQASTTGAQPNCKPFTLENEVYYVAINPKGLTHAAEGGQQLLRVSESAVTSTTSYNTDPVSLLATHLVDQVIRSAEQRAATDLDAEKGWLMRADGRLVASQMIRSQEITGFCEWIAASGGLVREIRVDGQNRLWLAIERAAQQTIEMYDLALFLQDVVEASTDLAGLVTGLPFENGAEVWAVADGYVLGPKTVAAGAIDLEDPYDDVIVGRWQAPRFESMGQVFVTPADEVIWRPGRIHTVYANVMDTTSLAIGANGEAPADVTLYRASDPVDQPMPGKTELVTVTGLTGFQTGTTMVITQTRPGRLRIKDYALGAKL